MGVSGDEMTAGYFSEGDIPTFKLLKQSTGEMITLDGNIPRWTSTGIFILDGLSEMQSIPDAFSLSNVYPNPFNPKTTINFGLPEDSQVNIAIYNLQGRLVETLANHIIRAGYHSVIWNADNFSSGIYILKIQAVNRLETQKLMLIK